MKEIKSERLKEQWYYNLRFFSKETEKERLKKFNQKWEIFENGLGKKSTELLSIPEGLYKEWKETQGYYEYKKFFFDEKGKKEMEAHSAWDSFKKAWQYPESGIWSEENLKMFEDFLKMSEGMLNEWRLFYRDKSSDDKYSLWKEFVLEWGLCFDENYNEHIFDEMIEELQKQYYLKERMSQEWEEYKTDSNYHSYDSYPIKEQYEIWCAFSNEWELD